MAVEKKPRKKKLTTEQLEQAKRLAFILFTENGLEQKEISRITGISEPSITAWKRQFNWVEEREQLRIGPEKEMRRFRSMINYMLDTIESRKEPDNFPTPAESDTISKLSASISKLQGDGLPLAHISETGKLYIKYIQETYGQSKSIEHVELWYEFLMSRA